MLWSDSFQEDIIEFLGTQHAAVVSSCTAALHLSLLSLGIGHGDYVLVPDFTFPATANVVELVGATPLFVDIDINTYNIDVSKIIETIDNFQFKDKIKAIIPVHEFGCPANIVDIVEIAEKYKLKIIEDSACAFGTTINNKKAGTFGDLGCFSFHPRKALTTGEGGAVVSNDPNLIEKIKILRNHGISYQDGRIDFVSAGFNYRMTNFQAAMGRVQLRKFIDNYPKRIGQAQEYLHILEPYSDLISLPNNSEGHSWQTFMIILPEDVNRSEVINKLKLLGIETNLGAQALHMLTYFKDKYGINENSLPRARKAFLHGLALPMGNHLKEEDISIICKHLINLIKL